MRDTNIQTITNMLKRAKAFARNTNSTEGREMEIKIFLKMSRPLSPIKVRA